MQVFSMSYSKDSLRTAIPFLMALLFLTIPLSSTGKSISIILVILAICLSPDLWQKYSAIILKQGWCKAAIVLFLISLVACFWGPATIKEKFLVLEKYSKLLYLPILVMGFQYKKTRCLSIHAFLLAMAITGVVSIMRSLTDAPNAMFAADFVFRNHIMTSMMMVFATYLCIFLFLRQQAFWRFSYLALAALFSYQVLFISLGRAGYFLYALVMILLVIQTCTKKQLFLALTFFCTVYSICFLVSPLMQSGIKLLYNNFVHFNENKNTSIGYRIQFHGYAKKLFKRHPIGGNGTGSFGHLFNVDRPVAGWSHLLEPHSQYWLIAVEFGLVGLAAFAVFLASLFIAAWKLSIWRFPTIVFLIMFLLGNLTDSLLLYSGSGYFFIAFMALFLSEKTTELAAANPYSVFRAASSA